MERLMLARIVAYLRVSPAVLQREFLLPFSCLPCGVWRGKGLGWWCVPLVPTMMSWIGRGGRSRFGGGKFFVWRPLMD